MAASLGFNATAVIITHINGAAVGTSRRLRRLQQQLETPISFDIESASNDRLETQRLRNNIEKAAQNGAIVANVQQEAAKRQVLTRGLKEMTTITEVKTSVSTRNKVVMVAKEGEDTTNGVPDVTTTDTSAKDDHAHDGILFHIELPSANNHSGFVGISQITITLIQVSQLLHSCLRCWLPLGARLLFGCNTQNIVNVWKN